MERGAAKLAKLRLAQTDAAPFPAPRTDVTARSTGFKSNGNFKSHCNGNGNGNDNGHGHGHGHGNCNRNRNHHCSQTAHNLRSPRSKLSATASRFGCRKMQPCKPKFTSSPWRIRATFPPSML
ncbi:hypothetical protein ABC383_00880 [Noviherbaspirillum sp. 1P10PC]|uniref:hypothetical protein n=1 Tax=Noviherbaspirillum sp. 1P10PC TaxID=3132292 RepID=UPI0039A0B6CB